ncbi:MAG TPA: hypothetical protein VFU02_10725 [Polyangiaceae bacterium]|nr:hypothetical protein [Polyangiaceae bacterium]
MMLKLASSGAWAGLCLVALAPACRRNDVAERAHAPANREQGPARAVDIDLTPGEPAGDNRFRNDPLWQRAGVEHAEIDLMRLANREGAAGLLEGLSVGRNVGLTALAALPHAEDGELALSRLCELLAHPGDQRLNPSLPVLRSVHGIAAQPPEQREALAASGYAGCVPVIERLAKLPNLDAERHDLASSAAASLVEHRDAARR